VVKKDGSVVSLSTAEVVERSDVRGEVPKFDYDEKHIAVRGVSPGMRWNTRQ
jgi:hypothetical protein